MDPITVAARRFLRSLDRFWKRFPERPARLVAAGASRGHVAGALRLGEHDPSNRRPLFLVESRFEDASSYWQEVVQRVEKDYALVRDGAAKEGVSLPPLNVEGRPREGSPETRAHVVLCSAAELLAKRLDGAVVALLPSNIAREGEFRASMEQLVRQRRPSTLRLAVLDTPEELLSGVLGNDGVELAVGMDELFDFLEQQAARTSGGPATPEPPKLPEDVRTSLELAGRKIPRPEVGAALQTMFLRGARASAKKDFKTAAQEYRRARDLCHDEGLPVEEAGAAFTLAGAHLAAGAIPLAQATYGQAALLAAEQKQWMLASQAKLGEAGAGWMDRDFPRAARAYAEAAALAEKGEIVLLRIEALRMEGQAHQLRGSEADAIRAWRRAVESGLAAEEPARRSNSFQGAVEALADLLERRGLSSQAAEVRVHLGPRGALS